MKSFICQMFYKQRAAFEQSYASRGKEYPLPEDVFLQSDIFYDEKHVPAHRLEMCIRDSFCASSMFLNATGPIFSSRYAL